MPVSTVAVVIVNDVYDSPIRLNEGHENGPFCFPLGVLDDPFFVT